MKQANPNFRKQRQSEITMHSSAVDKFCLIRISNIGLKSHSVPTDVSNAAVAMNSALLSRTALGDLNTFEITKKKSDKNVRIVEMQR